MILFPILNQDIAILEMLQFKAQIEIIGINPFVHVPPQILEEIFKQAGKDKGKIPVKMKIDGHEFTQTLIKYAGHWRLYLNQPMRTAAGKELGDAAVFELEFNPEKITIVAHPQLIKVLNENQQAKEVFDRLRPSLQLEIIRYISRLKTKESVDKNVKRAINFLLGKERFIGRDNP